MINSRKLPSILQAGIINPFHGKCFLFRAPALMKIFGMRGKNKQLNGGQATLGYNVLVCFALRDEFNNTLLFKIIVPRSNFIK